MGFTVLALGGVQELDNYAFECILLFHGGYCDSFLRKNSRGGYSKDIEEHRESQYWSFAEENGRGYVPGPLDVDPKKCTLVHRRGQWLGSERLSTEGQGSLVKAALVI